MNHPKIQVSVKNLEEEGISILEIGGEVNTFAEQELVDAYNQAVEAGSKALILDFNKMTFMNSGGIGLLVMLLIRANRQERRLIAVGLNEHFRHIFELTRLNEAFQIFDTIAQARASIAG
jgi:anti-sigma B factor antagonist